MPSESVVERAVEALFQGLRAVEAGDTYWYTPQVHRVSRYSRKLLNSLKGDCFYFLRPGEEFDTERTAGSVMSDVELFLLLAYHDPKLGGGEDETDEQQATRWKIQNRMVRDAKMVIHDAYFKVLVKEGFCDNLMITDVSRFHFAQPWALVEIRMIMKMDYLVTNP